MSHYVSFAGAHEYRSSGNYEHPSDLSMPPQTHHHHHHHVHHQVQQHSQDQHSQDHLEAVPKLEPPPTPPAQAEDMPGVVCAGCGLRISDRFYLQAVDRRWHASCLQCSHCRQGLDGEVTCFSRDGNIYCKKDYYRWVNPYFFIQSLNLFFLRRLWRWNPSRLLSEPRAFSLYFGFCIANY